MSSSAHFLPAAMSKMWRVHFVAPPGPEDLLVLVLGELRYRAPGDLALAGPEIEVVARRYGQREDARGKPLQFDAFSVAGGPVLLVRASAFSCRRNGGFRPAWSCTAITWYGLAMTWLSS